MIEIGSRTMGPASMALAQFFGSSVLSALLDNNVVADFAARAIQGLPTALILLFSMSQIAGYALGGCWTHIGSAQSVVAYAFIRRDLDPRFGPLQYVRAVSPLLVMMAVVLTLYIWQVLGAVKTEFGKYNDVLQKVREKLQQATNVVEKAEVRTRAITKQLRNVEELPEPQALALLGDADEPADDLAAEDD